MGQHFTQCGQFFSVIFYVIDGGHDVKHIHRCRNIVNTDDGCTAFRSRWANDLVYPIASFMLFRGPTLWRWSHYRHHTDTLIVGRDAEISFQRPADVLRTAMVFTGIKPGPLMFWRLVRHAAGRLDPDAAELVPPAEHRKVVWESRVFVAIVVAAVAWSLVAWTPLPILFIGGPTLYGMREGSVLYLIVRGGEVGHDAFDTDPRKAREGIEEIR